MAYPPPPPPHPPHRHACWHTGQHTLLRTLQRVGLAQMVCCEGVCLICAASSCTRMTYTTCGCILSFCDACQSLCVPTDYHPRIAKVELGMSSKLTWQGSCKCELTCDHEPAHAPTNTLRVLTGGRFIRNWSAPLTVWRPSAAGGIAPWWSR